MTDPFKLTVPVDVRYRALAPDVAGKYAELAGGTAKDGLALSTAVNAAMDKLANDAPYGSGVDLAFKIAAGSVEVHISCQGRSAVVKHAVHGHKH